MPFDYTGSFSGSFTGDITASNGVISSSAQVNYYNIQNKPTTISAYQANQIAANSYFRETTFPPASASFDSRINSMDARIDGLTAGSGSADWSTITNIPDGLISSSEQLPSGLVSSSTQITDIITDEYISASAAASGFGSGESTTSDTASYVNPLTQDVQITGSLHTIGDNVSFGNRDVFGNGAVNLYTNPDTGVEHISIGVSAGNLPSQRGNSINLNGSLQTLGLQSVNDITLRSVDGDIILSGSVNSVDGITGSLQGTADTASYVALAVSSENAWNSDGIYVGNADAFPESSYPLIFSQTQNNYTFLAGNQSNLTYNPFTDKLILSGSISVTEGVTGSLQGTADTASYVDPLYISASAAASGFGSGEGGANITYITESGNSSLTEIEVADFDNNVAVTFENGRLKFIFGTPTQPSLSGFGLVGFNTNRFNLMTDNYSIQGSWSNGGYTFLTASLWEGSTKITEVTGTGTSLSYNTTTSGSHTYTLQYTASSPLDGSEYKTSATATGTISKTAPSAPTLSATLNVQMGYGATQIEQGSTGSITFTSSSYESNNIWYLDYATSNVSSPLEITGSATGSDSLSISTTAYYNSPAGSNDPILSTSVSTTNTYTKIRSVRYGASVESSFTQTQLEDLALWDTTLGGTIGTIIVGDTTPSGNTVTISWAGDKYHYIVYDSARPNLSNITTNGFSVLSSFTLTTVGQYKVYRSNTLQAGSSGNSITYVLT